MKKIRFLWAAILGVFLGFAGRGDCMSVPLRVNNPTPSIIRSAEPVTSGVPLPESAQIVDAAALTVLGPDGQIKPAQFRVLARWHGLPTDATKPIKWVLVDFQADLHSEEATYVLTDQKGNKLPAMPVRVSSNDRSLMVDTGVARFVIGKTSFSFFDQVFVRKDRSRQMEPVLIQEGQGGLILKDAAGKIFDSLQDPPETVEVEERGPMKAVVRIRGVFKAADGEYFAPPLKNSPKYPRFSQPYTNSFFYYQCRLSFYAGKSYVRVVLTMENNGANGRTNPEQSYAPVQAVVFDQLEAVLRVNSATQAVIKTQDLSVPLQASDHFALLQDWRENLTDPQKGTREPVFEEGPYYEVRVNGESRKTGDRHPGWFRLETSDGRAVSVALLHFWENYPKKIAASPGELRLGLWPEEGYYPHCRSADFPEASFDLYCRQAGRDPNLYLFDAGRYKTHEFILDFGFSGEGTSAEDLASRLRYPLMAMASPQWFVASQAFGMIAPESLGHGDAELTEAMDRYNRLQLALVNPEVSQNGWTLAKLKTQNPPHWNYNHQDRFFGWMHFGDLLWAGQVPSALHYDWCLGMTLNYIRTGSYAFFEGAREMCRHRYDIDQYHGEREDTQGNHKWINHMAFYETDGHADPTISSYMPSRVAGPSHTWNSGLVLWSLLTGDPNAWEAAREVGQAAMNRFGSGGLKDASRPACAAEETRSETWPMLNLIQLYRVTGDPEQLRVARDIAKNRLLYREQKAGGQGYFGMGNNCDALVSGQQYNTMYSYALEPIVQVHSETQDPDIGALIGRMADFMKDKYLFGGDFNAAGLYRPLQSLYVWVESDPQGIQSGKTGEPVKDTFNGDLFAYAYLITKNKEYLQWARHSFRDAMFYYTVKGSTYVDPQYRAKVSFIDEMFAGTETKVHGWLGRTNHIYLYIEGLQ